VQSALVFVIEVDYTATNPGFNYFKGVQPPAHSNALAKSMTKSIRVSYFKYRIAVNKLNP